MRTFTVTTEANLKSITNALLLVGITAATEKKALEDLKNLNPDFDFNSPKLGTVLLVPEVPGINVSATQSLGDTALASISDTLRNGLKSVVERGDLAAKRDEQDANAISDFLKKESIRKLASENDTFRVALQEMKAEQKRSKLRADTFRESVETIQKEMDGEIKAITSLLT